MSAKLIWITPDAGKVVGYCARVSNPNATADMDSTNLLSYLIKNRHWSPLEMASACVEVTSTRDIARQLLRHRSLHFQEFSQRYAQVSSDVMWREPRLQHPTNRQDSLPVPIDDTKLSDFWAEAQASIASTAYDYYERALVRGIAKEVARALLPEGLTPSKLYVSGTLRDWYHYIAVRQENGTQKEHVELATAIRDILAAQVPEIFERLRVGDKQQV